MGFTPRYRQLARVLIIHKKRREKTNLVNQSRRTTVQYGKAPIIVSGHAHSPGATAWSTAQLSAARIDMHAHQWVMALFYGHPYLKKDNFISVNQSRRTTPLHITAQRPPSLSLATYKAQRLRHGVRCSSSEVGSYGQQTTQQYWIPSVRKMNNGIYMLQ